MITQSTVSTIHGTAYLRRLCKHFAHKIPATWDDSEGRIDFPFGVCSIDVDENEMRFSIDVADPGDVERAEEVVGGHLVRMANRDDPVVEWIRGDS